MIAPSLPDLLAHAPGHEPMGQTRSKQQIRFEHAMQPCKPWSMRERHAHETWQLLSHKSIWVAHALCVLDGSVQTICPHCRLQLQVRESDKPLTPSNAQCGRLLFPCNLLTCCDLLLRARNLPFCEMFAPNFELAYTGNRLSGKTLPHFLGTRSHRGCPHQTQYHTLSR